MDTLISDIFGVWKFRQDAGHVGKARSTPGHLIHFIADGRYHLTTDNREYDLAAGDMVYYFEAEEVFWRGYDVPVTFYSIGLSAPSLPPPELSSRVLHGKREMDGHFRRALAHFNDSEATADRLKLVGTVAEIMAEFFLASSPQHQQDQSLWWQVENAIKRERRFRADLGELCELAGYSRATVIRACRDSTGATPIARLRDLRMEEAKGLLMYSMSSVSDVATQLGYDRIHEFSRDFSQTIGMPPSEYRKRCS